MGEAFLMGGGGGATIQHITATDATSNTFTLTNPKRSKCLVFGRIYASYSFYNDWDGILSSAYTRDHTLYGSKYSVFHKGDYGNTSATFTTELGISFTRNDASITITLNSSYPFNAKTSYSYDFMTQKITNTIDIYVVDYD